MTKNLNLFRNFEAKGRSGASGRHMTLATISTGRRHSGYVFQILSRQRPRYRYACQWRFLSALRLPLTNGMFLISL